MANGKPVASANVPEARAFASVVRIAEQSEDFVPLIRDARKQLAVRGVEHGEPRLLVEDHPMPIIDRPLQPHGGMLKRFIRHQ